jgi:aminomethyltransferase
VKTPLFPVYEKQAKLIDFGGWELPVQFSSIKAEHEAVRTHAGLFDVSHMGEVLISGFDAEKYLQRMTTNDVAKLQIGQAQYSLLCYPDGGTVDDLLVYRLDKNDFMLVINAANIEKDIAWLKKQLTDERVTLENRSADIALLALQGPLAETILQRCTSFSLSTLKPFHFSTKVFIANVECIVSRTGYTGEDGFEIYVAATEAKELWKTLLIVGKADGLLPCGLGARDTLRLEVALPLYGQELSPIISPLEAGLGFAVKLDKGDFIGAEALRLQQANGVSRKKVGIEVLTRGIPRSHYLLFVDEQQVGEVTSGTQSPLSKRNIGLALVDSAFAQLEQELDVDIRGKRVKAKVVSTPFYRRSNR